MSKNFEYNRTFEELLNQTKVLIELDRAAGLNRLPTVQAWFDDLSEEEQETLRAGFQETLDRFAENIKTMSELMNAVAEKIITTFGEFSEKVESIMKDIDFEGLETLYWEEEAGEIEE